MSKKVVERLGSNRWGSDQAPLESEGLVVDDNNVFYPTQMIDNIRGLGKV